MKSPPTDNQSMQQEFLAVLGLQDTRFAQVFVGLNYPAGIPFTLTSHNLKNLLQEDIDIVEINNQLKTSKEVNNG